jgi:hypothetical protein
VKAEPKPEHLAVTTYGDFVLTDAVRPGPGVPIRPRQGYRMQVFRDRAHRIRIPMISAAVSSERIFDTFLGLLAPLGETVHVVLETSHGNRSDKHRDYRRKDIDNAVLASHFCDFEELLLNDGCTGVAILSASGPIEIQFDEHKLFHIYAKKLNPFRRVLRDLGIPRRANLPLISEGEHLHHSTDEFEDQFVQLCTRVGVADFDRVLSDEA